MARQAMRLVFCLLPFAGMVAGAAPEVVTAIYGRHFLPADHLLAFLIFAALGITMIFATSSMLIGAGCPKLLFLLTAPLVALAPGAHFILIPRFGAISAAIVTTALSWIGASAMIIAVNRIWHCLPSGLTLGRSIVISGIAYAASSIWPSPGLLLLLKLPVIGCLIIIAFFLMGELNSGDIAMARSVLPWATVSDHKRGRA